VALQIVSDLRVLRKLLLYLPRYDCVTFFAYLEALRVASKDQRSPSLWMYTNAGETVFRIAKERIYRIGPIAPGAAFTGVTVQDRSPGSHATLVA
jgi:hypothetical protein